MSLPLFSTTSHAAEAALDPKQRTKQKVAGRSKEKASLSLPLYIKLDPATSIISPSVFVTPEQPVQTGLTHQQRPKGEVAVTRQEKISLPLDIYTLVLPFLDPRGMMKLASTNKDIMALVTHEIVVVSTIMAGGPYSRWMAVRLFQVLRKQLIYLPSPMRMLRIMNGTRCESRGCSVSILCHESVFMGVLFCVNCFPRKTTMYSNETRRQAKYRDTLRHILFFQLQHSQEYPLLTRPFRSIDGQHNGTLVSSKDVKRLVRDGRSIDEYLTQNKIEVPDREYVDVLSAVVDSAMAATPDGASSVDIITPIKCCFLKLLCVLVFACGALALSVWFLVWLKGYSAELYAEQDSSD